MLDFDDIVNVGEKGRFLDCNTYENVFRKTNVFRAGPNTELV